MVSWTIRVMDLWGIHIFKTYVDLYAIKDKACFAVSILGAAPFEMLEITSIQWKVCSEALKHSFLLVFISENLY